jgi:hypothetical protein
MSGLHFDLAAHELGQEEIAGPSEGFIVSTQIINMIVDY